jgi:uncharacterized OB-fold protein
MPRPVPVADEDTKPFWDYCKQHEFRLQKCNSCGKLRFPVSPICPHCLGMEFGWEKLSGKGEVYSFVVVHRRYHPAFQVPYVVAIVEVEQGLRMITNVVGCKPDEVKVGMKVQVTFDDVSPEFSLPKFKPAM